MGLQLWFHAHGNDESNATSLIVRKSRGIGNSQILPYDYHLQADIELVFRRWLNRVAIRLRRKKRRPNWSPFMPPTPKSRDFPSIHCQQRLSPPNPPRFYIRYGSAALSPKYWRRSHSADRRFYGELVEESSTLSLFDDPVALEKRKTPVDHWPHSGPIWLYLSSEGSSLLGKLTRHCRSKLTGGHSAGGLDGLTWSTVLSLLSIRPRISKIVA